MVPFTLRMPNAPICVLTGRNRPIPAAGPRSPVLAITGRIPAPCRAYSGDTERVLEDALGARARQDKDLRSQLLQPFRAEFPDGFPLTHLQLSATGVSARTTMKGANADSTLGDQVENFVATTYTLFYGSLGCKLGLGLEVSGPRPNIFQI